MAVLEIPKFKAHFKLEFDIKTDMENMQEVLQVLKQNLETGLAKVNKSTEIEVTPTIIGIS